MEAQSLKNTRTVFGCGYLRFGGYLGKKRDLERGLEAASKGDQEGDNESPSANERGDGVVRESVTNQIPYQGIGVAGEQSQFQPAFSWLQLAILDLPEDVL